jgi:putative transposase
VAEAEWPEFRVHAKACYEAPSLEMARALSQGIFDRYSKTFPTAVACFEDDFEACIAHLRFPIAHRKVIRTTNLFVEERRRTKIIPNFFHGERPVLKLMYVALIRGAERWRGIQMSVFETRQLEVIRQELDEEHRRRHVPVSPADGISSHTAAIAAGGKEASKKSALRLGCEPLRGLL